MWRYEESTDRAAWIVIADHLDSATVARIITARQLTGLGYWRAYCYSTERWI
jgi:hypothetical protein